MFLGVDEMGRWEEFFYGRVLLGCSGGFFVGRLWGYGSFAIESLVGMLGHC